MLAFKTFPASQDFCCLPSCPCPYPEGRQGVRFPPGKSQKYRVFFSNSGLDPLKNHKTTKPMFGHLNGILLASR